MALFQVIPVPCAAGYGGSNIPDSTLPSCHSPPLLTIIWRSKQKRLLFWMAEGHTAGSIQFSSVQFSQSMH